MPPSYALNDRLQLARSKRLPQTTCRRAHACRRNARGSGALRCARPGSYRARVIDINVVLEGNVTLGDGVRIGPHVCIRDSSIGAATEIFANSVIDRAEVGRGCRIGPFARLRPEALLHDDVHVGNFVEVKKTEMKRGAKANHLTYLGDATVGEQANIGAGTVTCNYDGVNKSRTQIGDRAFIGSGTMLVAPVKVGDGATIGAGSTITHDAPADKLTLERSRQLTVDGWKRPDKNHAAPGAPRGRRRPTVASCVAAVFTGITSADICEFGPAPGLAGLE
jgi:bifunctional UDP-N-acetylglucosamine pyrophosphorylase/glucosamine-1-phosphate N-acetyltransferase